MGKAAIRRRTRRQEFLERLSLKDPERFEFEWGKRLQSWSDKIRQRGREGEIAGSPVFGMVDHALEILTECGPAAILLQYGITDELLKHECCRSLTHQIGEEIYRINQQWKTPSYLRRSIKRNNNKNTSG